MREKPIRRVLRPLPPDPFELTYCDRCDRQTTNDRMSGYRYEDTDKGDYIERRDVEHLCGRCMAA